eukprot:tig00000057_g30.t1
MDLGLERAQKRARAEEPFVCAAAAAEADWDGGINHFARLPDEIVHRIFSELEALDAYETCRLWSLDRRFRRLVGGVDWKHLRITPRCHEPRKQCCRNQYRKLLDRVTARARNGTLAGCEWLVIDFASPDIYGCEHISNPCTHNSCSCRDSHEKLLEASAKAAFALTEMLAALSAAAFPPEHVYFSDIGRGWPDSVSRDIARAFQNALLPAPIRTLQLFGSYADRPMFLDHFVPGVLPHLRNLEWESGTINYEIASKLVETWPRLKKIHKDLEATVEICCGLDDYWESMQELEEGLDSLDPDCVRKLGLRIRDEDGDVKTITPDALRTILHFRYIEHLEIDVDHRSGDLLLDLGTLKRLRTLKLILEFVYAPDGGAELLRAAAEGIGAAPFLESLALVIDGDLPERYRRAAAASQYPGVPIDPDILVSLIRAARRRPTITKLYISPAPATAEVLQEVALAGPQLESVYIRCTITGAKNVDKLVSLYIELHDALLAEACDVLRGWFKNATLPISISVNMKCISRAASQLREESPAGASRSVSRASPLAHSEFSAPRPPRWPQPSTSTSRSGGPQGELELKVNKRRLELEWGPGWDGNPDVQGS